ncbi:MAG: hypothetical protein D6722_17360 [Bacteroidetes bacterium]|nr:MAG: hypothetical protein D6722_17360 [Bacteroidota bacterium]
MFGLLPAGVWGQAIPDAEILPAMTPATIEDRERQAQEAGEAPGNVQVLEAGFVKESEQLPPGVMYFNVLRIQNNSPETYVFTPEFSVPGTCKLILQDQDQGQIELQPGQSRYMPVRLSFPSDVEGGVPYDVQVRLKQPDGSLVAAPILTQVQYRRVSRWRITTPTSKAYTSSAEDDFTEVRITLYNEGNALEMLELEGDIGRLLEVREAKGGKYKETVPLRPSTDTTIFLHVRVQPTEESVSGSPYRLVILAKGPSDTVAQDVSIFFESIDAAYRNQLSEAEAPLIISLNQAGLNEQATTLVNLAGHLLLTEGRELHYNYGFQQQFLGGREIKVGEMLWQGARILATYQNRTSQIRIGDVGGGTGLSIGGRGLAVRHEIGDTRLYGTFASNLRLPIWGVTGGVSREFSDRLRMQAGITYRKDKTDQTNAMAPSVGLVFSPLTGHTITAKAIATRLTNYGRATKPIDQRGLYYEIGYGATLGNFKYRIKNRYSSKDYLGGSPGIMVLDGEAAYKLANETTLKLRFRRNRKINEAFDEEDILQTTNQQVSQTLSLSYTLKIGKQSIGLGGAYTSHQVDNTFHTYDRSDFVFTRGYTFGMGTTIKAKNNKDIAFTPSIQMASSSMVHTSSVEAVVTPSIFKFKAGVRGRYKFGSLTADYIYEPEMQLQQQAFIEQKYYQQRVQLGTSFSNSFMGDKLSIASSATASYLLSDALLRTKLDARLSYRTLDGWNFSLHASTDPMAAFSGNLWQATAITLGLRKVIEGQQPRMKYYNLEVQFFKDEDGNRQRSENEAGIASVLVNLERLPDSEVSEEGAPEIRFKAPGIMSDNDGRVLYRKIPQGKYALGMKELFPPMEYTNLNGSEFELEMSKHTVMLVPYARSVAIVGKVNITRDKFSRLFGITPANIRVTVIDANGDAYYTLTDDRGEYIITVPFSTHYTIKMKNVLGDKFELKGAEQEIDVSEEDLRFEINFEFKEKGRSINFG